MLNDPLANVLSVINNSEQRGMKLCMSKPSSKLITRVLEIMNSRLYIGSFRVIEDGKGNVVEISLIGAINKCGAIKPRFSVKEGSYERFERRFLPAKDFGILIMSTSNGIMTHTDAKARGIGGKLLAYCY
ncbi:30S ribosomal protein S8 [Candidatus Woesearchaeota archaeon]|nr:30S ribosomal protein S8 [Candidatus Woesearchaeota archaeon]